MAKNTSNIDLVKPGVDEFYDVNIMNSNLDKIDSYTGEIKNKIYNGSIQNTNLQLGCNRIQIPEISVSPKIEFTGFSYVNLLGRDGNFENANTLNWVYNNNATGSFDASNKAFGNYGFKLITGNLVNPTIYKAKSALNLDNSKYYMFSAYIKNGNSSNGARLFVDGLNKVSPTVTDAINFNRVCVKLNPTEITTTTAFHLFMLSTVNSGQYSYFDGVMINEISAADYALSDTALLAKYPYVDSYACLTNPMFENRRHNLVRNGNCEEGLGYWIPTSSTLSVENGQFKLVTTTTGNAYQRIKVKPNTNYYLSGNKNGANASIRIFDSARMTVIFAGPGTFNTGYYTDITVIIRNDAAGTSYFNSIMLVEGNTATSEYKSCDLQRFVVEGQFTSDDTVTIENGLVSGLLNWKHPSPLYGKDFDWTLLDTPTGLKRIQIPAPQDIYSVSNNSVRFIKYDGKILPQTGESATKPDIWANNANVYILVSIANTDSGWTDIIAPNANEVKAYMNGWRAYAGTAIDGYYFWLSLVDGSFPPACYKTTTSTTGTGMTTITVPDGTKFSVNDHIYIGTGWCPKITAINGNVLTISPSINCTSGDVVVKGDNSVTKELLTWCKTNIAPGYEGYKLHYKLANPEPITDTNVHIEGEIWDLVKGDNYVTVDSGIVLGEVANPSNGNNTYSYYYINYFSSNPDSTLRYKNESILNVYKNNCFDNVWILDSLYPYGKQRAYTSLANFDTNATYTVDYQILKTLHSQAFGSLSLSYPQSIIATLEGHSKALEQKQAKNTMLDYIVDNSIYEEMRRLYVIGKAVPVANAGVEIVCYARPYPKKCVPVITVNFTPNTNICYLDSTGVAHTIPLPDLKVLFGGLNFDRPIPFYILYTGSDTTIRNNLLSYGGYGFIDITFDCRGRI